jgi:putative ABC transport system ATP-binding protein
MIRLSHVSKVFNADTKNPFYALSDISFSLQKGEVLWLKGASGSGKSTLLSLIAGLSKPTQGEIIVNDKRISKLPDAFASLFRRENIGFIFQKFNLIPTLSAHDNIIVPLIPSNSDEVLLKKRVDSLMHDFGIESKKETLVKHLSGGEQQRVVICRALINQPSIIIADEPTANLDEALSLEFITILKTLKAEGKTIIIASHDSLFGDVDFIDRHIEIAKGRLLSC